MKILIVEDDRDIADLIGICAHLQWPDAEQVHSTRGAPVVGIVAEDPPDLIVLDLGLPDMRGLEVLAQVRASSHVPVIIVTAKDAEGDHVRGLVDGADDYVTKPFSHLELMARMQALVRRASIEAAGTGPDTASSWSGLHVNPERRSVVVAEAEVLLTPNEWRLLDFWSAGAEPSLPTKPSPTRSGAASTSSARPSRRASAACAPSWTHRVSRRRGSRPTVASATASPMRNRQIPTAL